MKTWRQLTALAKRNGLTLNHGDRGWQLNTDDALHVEAEWWIGNRNQCQRALRAMCEAALIAMGKP